MWWVVPGVLITEGWIPLRPRVSYSLLAAGMAWVEVFVGVLFIPGSRKVVIQRPVVVAVCIKVRFPCNLPNCVVPVLTRLIALLGRLWKFEKLSVSGPTLGTVIRFALKLNLFRFEAVV